MKKLLFYLLTVIGSVIATLSVLILVDLYSPSIGFEIIDKELEAAFAEEDAKYDSVLHAKVRLTLAGDELAYERLERQPIFYSPREILPYSLLMSNKYNSGRGSWNVYYVFREIYQDISMLDELSYNMAIYYLKKSADLGYSPAKHELSRLQEQGLLDSYKSPFCN